MEKQIPQDLTGEEIRTAVIYKLYESLSKTCYLSDTAAYAYFRADITVRLKLCDKAMSNEIPDNHMITVEEGIPEGEITESEFSLEIPKLPPNQVRIDTNQDVPVKVTEGDKTFIRKVKYVPRKK